MPIDETSSPPRLRFRTHRDPSDLARASMWPSELFQVRRLNERRGATKRSTTVCAESFEVLPGVYDTGVDTELMAAVARVPKSGRFLEVGCGTGAVSLLMARRCRGGIGTDVNANAVRNARTNQQRLGVVNAEFIHADLFGAVATPFDTIVCNPPYNDRIAGDAVEKMFWDEANDMKRRFFAEAAGRLKRRGRIYFGWADFRDLDNLLPLRLARRGGLEYRRHYSMPSGKGIHRFYVIEFGRT